MTDLETQERTRRVPGSVIAQEQLDLWTPDGERHTFPPCANGDHETCHMRYPRCTWQGFNRPRLPERMVRCDCPCHPMEVETLIAPQ